MKKLKNKNVWHSAGKCARMRREKRSFAKTKLRSISMAATSSGAQGGKQSAPDYR